MKSVSKSQNPSEMLLITPEVFNGLPKLYQAAARLLEKEGQVKIIPDSEVTG